jgi:hypothetical protein
MGINIRNASEAKLGSPPLDAATTDLVIATFLQDLRQVVAGIHAGAASVREELRY